MELNNKLVTTIITLTVVVIAVATILMPVINNASSDETYTNVLEAGTTYALDIIEPSNSNVEITTDITNSKLLVNGQEYIIDSTHEAAIMMDGGYFRFASVNDALTTLYAYQGMNAQASTTNEATVTILNGDVAFNSGSISQSWNTNDFIFIPSTSGEYYLRAPTNGPQYINSINDIYVSAITNNKLVWGHGNTLTDGTDSYEAVLTSNVQLVDGSTNVYELPDMKSYRMMDGGSGFYPSRVIVPASVEGTSEGWDSAAALLQAIPVLLIVSLVLGTIGLITVRRE